MKILQVNCVYPTGSTGKITYDIHGYLTEHGVESVVCFGRGALVNEENVHKVCPEWYSKLQNLKSRFTGLMYGGCSWSTAKLINRVKAERPDVVHLQCINGYFVNIYKLVQWLKEAQIPTIVTLHAEFMYTANCGHAMECENWKTGCGACPRVKKATKSLFFDSTSRSFEKMQKAFKGFENQLKIVSVSPWLMKRALQSPILDKMSHQVILNGVDTSIFTSRNTEHLRKKYNLDDKKSIFHATAMFCDEPGHAKGGEYIIQLAKKLKDVQFFVAGESKITGEIPENMILLGKIQDQKLLAEYYSMADVTLITSKRETFSMPCAESLCCGTPVAGFRAGGPEQITLKEYSTFVEYGDTESLLRSTKKWLYEEKKQTKMISQQAKELYSKEKMASQYMDLYRGVLND